MFTTGFATKNSLASPSSFLFTSQTANGTYTTFMSFELPQDINFVTIVACGGGGAGGAGGSAASGLAKWGGGGGGAGAIAVGMWPRYFLPDTLILNVGCGGNTVTAATPSVVGTFMSVSGSAVNGILVRAVGGTAGAAGTTTANGAGGTAAATTGWGQNYGYYYSGFGFTEYAGRVGQPGDGFNNQTTPLTYSRDTATMVSGGIGGGTVNTTSTAISGDGIFLLDFSDNTAQPYIGNTTIAGLPGLKIKTNTSPLYFTGGTGGAASGAGVGLAGGRGGPGCGGGGGGGGTTGGAGGAGGDGWILINYW